VTALRFVVLFGVLLGAALLPAGPRVGAQDVTVAVEPPTADVTIGEEGILVVTITNHGQTSSGPLVAHLVVMDPKGGGSADAEDWTTELNRVVDSLAPAASHTIAWDTKPIMAGDYLVVITVAPVDPGNGSASVSPVVRFTVGQPSLLVSGATIPVSVAVPLVVVAGAVLVRWREQRRVASL